MLSFRSNPSKTKHAIYSGACRIGYIDHRNNGEAVWHLMLLQPAGTSYMGVSADDEAAKVDAERAFKSWCEAAGLSCAVVRSDRGEVAQSTGEEGGAGDD